MSEEKKSVLVVDDDGLVRKAYRRFLEDKNYQVTMSNSAKDAIQYRDGQFDLLILDGLEGECFNLYNILNAKRKVIITGSESLVKEAREKSIESYDKMDAVDFLTKKLD